MCIAILRTALQKIFHNKIAKNNMNNADYGLTLQSLICDYYKLEVNPHAYEQFSSNYNDSYEIELSSIIPRIFNLVGDQPVRLLTYTQELTNDVQTTSPHNFLLKSGKTLSIRTTRTSDKVAPRTVGQAGYPILNMVFGDIYGKTINTQEDVRDMIYNHIHEVLPIFIDHLFISDFTVIINRQHLEDLIVVNAIEVGNYGFNRNDFTFTRNPGVWKESTTLKYNGTSIAEIQTHANRTFKFRFIISAIPNWFKTVKETTETFGITAEAAICEHFKLTQPDSFRTRVVPSLKAKLMPIVKEAFKTIPSAIQHTGSTPGSRGKNSKCPYDFLLEGNIQLSVKTNKGRMVCPPDVGQPCADTCFEYFKDFLPSGSTTVTNDSFKTMVYNNIEKLIPIYINHLFESEWLLWIYLDGNDYSYLAIKKNSIQSFVWEKEKFTFTKSTIDEWKESNTVKYNGVTLGEFQVHNHRSCFKFRFNMPALLAIVRRDS